MSIFDKLKLRKKIVPEKKPSAKPAKEEPKVPTSEVIGKKVTVPPSIRRPRKKDFSEAAVRFLVTPHVTEKATDLVKKRKYIFKVRKQANKTEIKKAIQELYGVRVRGVNIVNIPRKPRRLGRSEGYKSGYKKAIITLAEGEKIEVMPR